MLVGVNIRIMCLLHLAFQVFKYNFFSWGLRPTYFVASVTLSFMPDGKTQGKDEKGETCRLEAGISVGSQGNFKKGCWMKHSSTMYNSGYYITSALYMPDTGLATLSITHWLLTISLSTSYYYRHSQRRTLPWKDGGPEAMWSSSRMQLVTCWHDNNLVQEGNNTKF